MTRVVPSACDISRVSKSERKKKHWKISARLLTVGRTPVKGLASVRSASRRNHKTFEEPG